MSPHRFNPRSMSEQQVKRCRKCLVTKPVSEFFPHYARKGGRDGKYKSYCKRCHTAINSEIRREKQSLYPSELVRQREYSRDRRFRLRYGMSRAIFEEMLAEQGHQCAICHTKDPGRLKIFAVDHNHVTNAIRGLLCERCNRALGLFRDDPEVLRQGAAYLEQHRNHPNQRGRYNPRWAPKQKPKGRRADVPKAVQCSEGSVDLQLAAVVTRQLKLEFS